MIHIIGGTKDNDMKKIKFDKDKVDKTIPVDVEKAEKQVRETYKGKFKTEQGSHRTALIANCHICQGKPTLIRNVLSGLEYDRCKECWEIVNYRKI